MSGSLLVAGTTSDAGKSLVTAGLCRWLARSGVRVAPFKAQNMSNNSMVCADGSEIGRAQWVQARACGVEPEAAMNPVLLKPGTDRRSHVVLRGRPAGSLEAGEFATGRAALAEAAREAYRELRTRFDVVVCEGAGSPAEINLRAGDYVNMGHARAFDIPVVVVADIDRGGSLAAMYGTLALLDPEDQALLTGWIVNKFRGDESVLRPGLERVEALTGRPVLGVLPWLEDVWIDGEDALTIGAWGPPAPTDGVPLRIAVVRFPRTSNATDVDALAAEPGVQVTVTADPDAVAAADVVVLPGSRATLSDLAWLRTHGLAEVVSDRAARGAPVLGICGGYQMLARTVTDPIEARSPEPVAGLGLLPTEVAFAEEKILGRPSGSWRGHDVDAYEIHHGVAALSPGESAEPFLDGWRRGAVWGTTWHGAFENDAFRRAWLTEAAAQAGLTWTATDAPGFDERRELMLDRLADAVEKHLDTTAILRTIEHGADPLLPTVTGTLSP